MPHDSPLPRVHTLGSDEGRMQPNELMELVTKLSDRVAVLENDLKQTKKTHGAAFTKLIKKMIHHDAQTQGRQEYDLEPNFKFTASEEVYTAGPDISTANVPVSSAGAEVSTAAKNLVYIRRSAAKRKYKGKAKVEESEPTQTKTKIQQEQERLGVHEKYKYFQPEEWEKLQVYLKFDEELITGYKLIKIEKDTLKLIKLKLLGRDYNKRRDKFAHTKSTRRNRTSQKGT
ncbi:hypothetical protein Tco_1090658 [Tanacetum coccineum]|uniref:Uncharacterized protein n=1 Tax=Tanacetum coccineum TaxID=301880 RepID=A0ABQ5I4W7_9ASTR